MTDDDKKEGANPPQPPQGDASVVMPEIPVRKAHSLAEYIDTTRSIIVESGRIPWFRGHADTNWQLAPSIFRDLISEGVTDKRMKKLRGLETEANLNFLHQAKARDSTFPHDDQVRQLVVARHHGLLSRLLDWSESPLTALFFAVEGDAHKANPACVWALDPNALNEKQWGEMGIAYSYAPIPKVMARCAFNDNGVIENTPLKKLVAKKWGVVAAFKPPHTIPRHMVQKAQFTIHYTPEALDKLPGASEFLSKIVIPFDKRKEILKELRWAGVSRDLLFPDLDNLSEHLNAEIERRMGK